MEAIVEVDKGRDAPVLPGSRRQSVLTHSRRQSQASVSHRRSVVGPRGSLWGTFRSGFQKSYKYENTYRMQPKESERIKQKKLEDMVDEVLKHLLESEAYDPRKSQSLSLNLANVLRKRARELCTPSRYKIITQVYIGSCKNATVSLSSRALWHPESNDTFVESTFSNSSIYAVALVFCVYFE
ncbi:Tctex1 domain-containing protein 1 [Fasciolopsis buskii]|uniref:Tctex1 domain-containing protein 1 n=1 Tax=Fasciolopsis buskii TaxID=27845 RepID=A0A8E0S4T4_9TREM|nr:Tctex1 domain-containing protein 1 [Fasciolopsis buski]